MNTLLPIDVSEVSRPLWEIGSAGGVSRIDLHAILGEPSYMETDGSRTFGGEEDWWTYRGLRGASIVICLRVPYRDAVIYVSELAADVLQQAKSALQLWEPDLHGTPLLQ